MTANLPQRFGIDLIQMKLRSHEQVLETIDEQTLNDLGKAAKEGKTLPEFADVLGISFSELVMARTMSEDFDNLMKVLETRAAGKHLSAARLGVKNPKGFSAAAYDRVMGALGFTPHVTHVALDAGGGSLPEGNTAAGAQKRVGFKVDDFISKHEAKIQVVEGELVPPTEESAEDIL